MGLKDILNASKIKAENEDLRKMLTPEMQDALKLQETVRNLQSESDKLRNQIAQQQTQITRLNKSISDKKSQLIIMDDDILVQEFGLYKPKYDFENSDLYKERLQMVRDKQKEMIKKGIAATVAKPRTSEASFR